jgi:4-hydroxy-tetrahydrodipicolinate reductase
MKNVKIMLYGVGAVGAMIGKFLLEKEGAEIVSAVDVAPDKVGKDLGDLLGSTRKLGVNVENSVDSAAKHAKPDVAVHATSSFLQNTFPQIVSLVEHGINVVSTCEELSYPYLTEPKLAKQLDTVAKEHDVTVLGTGINPGFLMDTLVIALTAPCEKIEKIEAVRVMNAATRRLPFQKKVGAGLTPKEFNTSIEQKKITGHVGLEQSIAMISNALAIELDEITAEQVEPVIARETVQSKDITVKEGNVAGIKQKAKGTKQGKEIVTLNFQAFIGAKEEYDEIRIKGVPPINQKITPCVHGDRGTVAMIVNAIPKVINAPAGLVTMKDLPLPSAAIGQLGKYVLPN